MQESISPLTKLELSLCDTSGVYVNSGIDPSDYFTNLADDIRQHLCEPFPISAVVMPPGFSDIGLGSRISGQCVAHRTGYWLVYEPSQDRFYCFWGTDPGNLGAHGVSGSPLYCWSA